MWFFVLLLLALVVAAVVAGMYLRTRSRMGPEDYEHNAQDDVSSQERRLPGS
jgi:hypothetical protein